MTRTLLLADDSNVIRGLVERGLAGEDFKVLTSHNGEDAIATARAMRPDIVLADVSLPGLNGYQLCASIKQNPDLSTVPVVLLAGAFDPYDDANARASGADDHLTKPFEADRLIRCVRGLLESAGAADPLDPLLAEDLEDSAEAERQRSSPVWAAAAEEFVATDELDLDAGDDLLDVLPLPKDDPAIADYADEDFDFGAPAPPEPVWRPEPVTAAARHEGAAAPADAAATSAGPEAEILDASPLPETEAASEPGQGPRRAIHDSVKRAAQEAFGEYPEDLVATLVERIEAVAWEVIPEMAETLIREEIRRMKASDE